MDHDLLFLLFASLVTAGVMALINMLVGGSPMLKITTYALIWIGVILATVSLVAIAAETL